MSRSRYPKSSAERRGELETKMIRRDGVGEDPAIQALVSEEFQKKNNKDTLEILLAIQENIIQGRKFSEQQMEVIQKLNARMDKYDEAQKKWEEDKLKFLQEVNDRADKLRTTDPDKKESMQAQVGVQMQEAYRAAMAKRAADALALRQRLAEEPKVTVTSPGIVVMVSRDNGPTPTLTSDFIRLSNFVWELPPGVPTSVPKSAAMAYESVLRSRAEAEERQSAMRVGGSFEKRHQDVNLVQRQKEIDRKYGVTTESIPIASE